MNTSQEKEYNPAFNDTYLDAIATSGKAMRAETIRKDNALRTREQVKKLIQGPLNIQPREYARIMGQYNALMGLKSKDERKAALGKMDLKEKNLMVKALRLRDIVRKMDERERLSLANDEIGRINFEDELFNDLNAELSKLRWSTQQGGAEEASNE
jgi:hypothetical protein